MKVLLCLVIIAAAGFAIYKNVTPDPVEKMEERMRNFPEEAHIGDGSFHLYEARYNVTKTDSLSAPIIGLVTFSQFSFEELHYEIVFHWRDGKWIFNGLNCTNIFPASGSFALSMLESPEIDAFIRGKKPAPLVSSLPASNGPRSMLRNTAAVAIVRGVVVSKTLDGLLVNCDSPAADRQASQPSFGPLQIWDGQRFRNAPFTPRAQADGMVVVSGIAGQPGDAVHLVGLPVTVDKQGRNIFTIDGPAVAESTPAARPVLAAKPTPSPLDISRDIARRYGTK